MPRFIKLTSKDSPMGYAYLNVDHIIVVEPSITGGSLISVMDVENAIHVNEECDEVIRIIENP